MIVILSNRTQPTKTNKLPFWPFWDKNHLTGFRNTYPVQNKKILPLFV
jgi:hypothetical protein